MTGASLPYLRSRKVGCMVFKSFKKITEKLSSLSSFHFTPFLPNPIGVFQISEVASAFVEVDDVCSG